MTDASLQALNILRSTEHFKWYIVPFLVLVIYVYAVEIQKRNWDAVLIGLLFIAGDFIWEIINALILHFTQYAALWSTPGDTAYLILVGINIEIFLLFSITGIIFVKILPEDRAVKITGIPNRIFIPLVVGAFSICIEILLNRFNALVWEYRCWGNWPHIWSLIINYMTPYFLICWGYFNVSTRGKAAVLAVFLSVNIVSWIVFVNVLGWI